MKWSSDERRPRARVEAREGTNRGVVARAKRRERGDDEWVEDRLHGGVAADDDDDGGDDDDDDDDDDA